MMATQVQLYVCTLCVCLSVLPRAQNCCKAISHKLGNETKSGSEAETGRQIFLQVSVAQLQVA